MTVSNVQFNRTRLAYPSIGLSIIGVLLTYLESERMGLTLIFFSALFIFGTFIYNRLQVIGAEQWAIGSIIVWIGFFLFSLPIFGVAWKIIGLKARISLFIFGIVFILLGFATEFFDLNLKLLKLVNQTKIKMEIFFNNLKARLLSSVWTFLIFIASSLLIVSFFFPIITESIDSNLPDYNFLATQLILVYIIIISILMEIRELLSLLIISFGTAIKLLLKSLTRRLIQFRELIISLFFKLKLLIIQIWGTLKNFVQITFKNNYSFGFFLFIIFSVLSYTRSDMVLFAISTLMLFASLTTWLLQKPEFIANTISRIHHSTYQRSLKIRNRFSEKNQYQCPNCSIFVSPLYLTCPRCKAILPTCSVCRKIIKPDTEVLICTHCQRPGHRAHIERWLSIKANCPNCHLVW
ncbi:MAG: hypothetical protein HeimC2_22900 [Candidatus Heimdallarchaeota archaeon LC_2]|nr:MAG: hypothetical protein HeimC2_22900 [Candidatus Heimdallarchaeota archaeon LC_2]